MPIEGERPESQDPMIAKEANKFNQRRSPERRTEKGQRVEDSPIVRCNELRGRFEKARQTNFDLLEESPELKKQVEEIENALVIATVKASERLQLNTESRNTERASRMLPGSNDYEMVPELKEHATVMNAEIESATAEIENSLKEIEEMITLFEVAIKIEAEKRKEK